LSRIVAGAAGRRLPDDALEGIGDVDVALPVEGERVEAGRGMLRARRHEGRGLAGERIHLQDLAGAEVAEDQALRAAREGDRRAEAEAERMRARVLDRDAAHQVA